MDEPNVMGPLSHSTTPPEMDRDPPIANSENSITIKEEGDGVLGKRPRKSSLTSSAQQHPTASKKPKVEDPVAKAERRRILEEKKRLLADVEQELARISNTKSPSPSIGSVTAAVPPKHSISAPSTPLPAGAPPAPPAGRGVVPPSLTPSATRGKRKSPSSSNIPRRASHDVSVGPTSPTEQGPVTRAKRARRPKRLDTFGGPANLSWALRQCQALLRLLMNHNFGWPFNQPVDPIALNIPDYFDVIKNPMDLGTIKEQLDAGYYETEDEFAEDVRLVWSNTFTYNQPGSDICVMASALSVVFNEKFAILKAKIEERGRGGGTPEGMEQTIQELRDSMSSVQRELERIKKPSNGRATGGRAAREEDARPMTFEEKKKLSHAINNLPSENLGMVVKIIHERMPQLTASGEEIEIDIDALNPATLRHLERYVRSVTQRAGRRRGSRTSSLSGSSSSSSTSSSSASSSSSSSSKHVQNEPHAPLGTQQKIEDVERQIKALTEHQQALTQKGLARSSGAETDLLMAAVEEKKKKRNDDESESSESESDGSDSESSDSETSDSESDSGSDSESTDTEAGEKKEDPTTTVAATVAAAATTTAAAPPASAETPAGGASAASTETPIAGNSTAVMEEAAASATSPATAPSTLAEGGGHQENGKAGSAISFGFDPTLGAKEPILSGGGGSGGAEDGNGDESLQQGAAVAADDAPPKSEAPKEVALKNVDAWSELSDDFEARTEKPQSPPSLDKTWSQFQTKKMQDAMREKERLEKEERERRERERREEERRYEEERRKREMEQAEERRQREIEEAELSAQRERERQRQAERLAREKGTLSMMEQSMLMASFEQQAPAVPLFQYKQLDDEEADFADLAGDPRGQEDNHQSLGGEEEGSAEGSEMELSPTAPLPVPASDEMEEGQI